MEELINRKQNQEVVSDASRCEHCLTRLNDDFENKHPHLKVEDHLFCCMGCKTVYALIHQKGLDHYYDLKKDSAWLRPAVPVNIKPENYAYLDDEAFVKDYVRLTSYGREMEFYLEGVHCVACLWLIEKLPQILPGVIFSRLDLGKSIARVVINNTLKFSEVVLLLAQFGYKAHPIKQEEERRALEKKENQSLLIRLGVAAAATGNIMLMAVSLYAGAKGREGRLFEWISFFLFLPVLFYSAVPFFKSSYAALQARTLSIDVPVMFAVVVGSVTSFVNLVLGTELIYFDSLSTLIFLLLISRYLLKRIQQNVFSSSHLLHFLTPSSVMKWNVDKLSFEEVSASLLKRGDCIRIDAGQTLAADGVIIKGESSVDNSMLTGESTPVSVRLGDEVFSGALNLSSPIEIEVRVGAEGSRLGRIVQEIESGNLNKAKLVRFSDQLAQKFMWGVFIAALAVFFYFLPVSLETALNRSLALIIVTCPCTFAFATPLVFSLSLKRLARAGILVKGSEVLEKLTQVKTLLLDKTGTLSEGKFALLGWLNVSSESDLKIKEVVFNLERQSKHPIAQALVSYFTQTDLLKVIELDHFEEKIGVGVKGEMEGNLYSISSLPLEKYPQNMKHTTGVGLWKNESLCAQFFLGDEMRRECVVDFSKLKPFALNTYIVSGDNPNVTEVFSQRLGIPKEHQISLASPEQKRDLASSLPYTMMVGDGANDALALSQAFVGVAVAGSMEVSLRAAEIYFTQMGLSPLVKVMQVAKDSLWVVYRNFFFSFFYNLVGATLSVLGYIHPFFAAVLMPLSSLSVLSSSFLATRRIRKLKQ